METQPARFTRCIMIQGGLCNKTAWIVNENTVDGLEMITLSKSDSGFSRFVSGSVKGIQKMMFLDELRKMRTRATIDACNDDGLFDSQSIAQSRDFKARKDSWKNAGTLPAIVEITLPAVNEFRATKVRVQSSLEVRTNVSIALNVHVLDHIATLMRNSEIDCPQRQNLGHGIRWCETRKCYIATRATKRMRLFRPNIDSADHDLADEIAKDEAVKWAAKDTDSDEEEDANEGRDEAA